MYVAGRRNMRCAPIIFIMCICTTAASASSHVCQFRKDIQRLSSPDHLPTEINYLSDKIVIPDIAFSQGSISLRDSSGIEIESVPFEAGTKEYDPNEGPLRYFHVRFEIQNAERDLGLVFSPTAPTVYAQSQYDYLDGSDFVLVNSMIRCWLAPSD